MLVSTLKPSKNVFDGGGCGEFENEDYLSSKCFETVELGLFSTAAKLGRGCCLTIKETVEISPGVKRKRENIHERKKAWKFESRDCLLESEQWQAYVTACILVLQLEGGGDLVQFSKVFNLGKCVLFLKC